MSNLNKTVKFDCFIHDLNINKMQFKGKTRSFHFKQLGQVSFCPDCANAITAHPS